MDSSLPISSTFEYAQNALQRDGYKIRCYGSQTQSAYYCIKAKSYKSNRSIHTQTRLASQNIHIQIRSFLAALISLGH